MLTVYISQPMAGRKECDIVSRMQSTRRKQMLSKIMPYLWRLNNWIDNKAIHIRAWLTAALDSGEWDTDMDNDIIAKMWKEKHS